MLQIDHRESHDIDLFLDDPQILPFLNPETQGIPLERRPDAYDSDGTVVLKAGLSGSWRDRLHLCTEHRCRPDRSERDSRTNGGIGDSCRDRGQKVYFRGWNFQPRDMFDLAAVVERRGVDYVVAALHQCGPDRCRTALDTIEKVSPAAVEAINAQLMIRDGTRHLIGDGR